MLLTKRLYIKLCVELIEESCWKRFAFDCNMLICVNG